MSDDFDETIETVPLTERLARIFGPALLVKGIVSIITGIVLLFWPTAGLAVTAITLGAYLIIDGVERLVTAFKYPAEGKKSDLLRITGALLRLIFGILILFNPVETGTFWVTFIFILAGLNLVITSLLVIWKDHALCRDGMMLAGTLVMLILGLLMILLPLITAVLFLKIIGIILILGAVPAIAMALRSR